MRGLHGTPRQRLVGRRILLVCLLTIGSSLFRLPDPIAAAGVRLFSSFAPTRWRSPIALRAVGELQESDREAVDLHARLAARADARAETRSSDLSRREAHNSDQAAAFDEAAAFFASDKATPAKVVPALQHIAAAVVGDDPGRVVIDAGCGAGALVPFLAEAGLPLSHYVGVDLSSNMLAACRDRLSGLSASTARTWQGDIIDLDKRTALGPRGESLGPAALHRDGVGAVVFNAVFGNVYDQRAALSAAAALLGRGGRVVLSHPLGRAFLEGLRTADPVRVPHSLPSASELDELLLGLPLELERAEGADGAPDGTVYLVVLRKAPVALLLEPFLASGPVEQGFGRGSKKLGFPTANLPASPQLNDVDAGVYCGWAALGSETYPAVVNIGFAPTFVGSEHKQKIIEAHLMDYPETKGDFHGEELTLLLAGQQRPELKFEGFQELTEAIATDVADARSALSRDPRLSRLRSHPLLQEAESERRGWQQKELGEWLADC